MGSSFSQKLSDIAAFAVTIGIIPLTTISTRYQNHPSVKDNTGNTITVIITNTCSIVTIKVALTTTAALRIFVVYTRHRRQRVMVIFCALFVVCV